MQTNFIGRVIAYELMQREDKPVLSSVGWVITRILTRECFKFSVG